MIHDFDNPPEISPDSPAIEASKELPTPTAIESINVKINNDEEIQENQNKTRDCILGTVPKITTKKINQKSLDIKQIVLNITSEDMQKREQAAKIILRFIHFYIRKIRHQNPTRYIRNGETKPSGLNEHDMDDMVQYTFLHVFENSHKINTNFDNGQIRLYLNKMIASGYYNWHNRQKNLINIPKRYNDERKNLPRHYNQFDEFDSTIENTHLINSLDDENTEDSSIGNLCDFKNPEKELIQKQIRETYENLFNEFPKRERTILHERFVKGTAYHKIGEKVGLSPQNIERISKHFITKMDIGCPSETRYGKVREKIQELRYN